MDSDYGRLDQHGAMDDKRKIHRHRVVTLIDHRLGEVERGHARALQELVVEQHLVLAGLVAKRLAEQVAQLGAHVVGRKNCVLRSLVMPFRAVREHVGQRPHEHTHLTVECGQSAERFHALALRLANILDQPESLAVTDAEWDRANLASASESTTGPEPGPPPPWGVEKVYAG